MNRILARAGTAALVCAVLAACTAGSDVRVAAPAGSPGAAAGTSGPASATSTEAAASLAPTSTPTSTPTSGPSASATGVARSTGPRPTPRSASASSTKPAATKAGSRWRPRAGLTWQWQLSGTIDTSVDADVFDVDLFETPASTVKKLHAKGSRVICYVNVGASESYRPDAGSFPASVLGKSDGWAGEKWLDIRRTDILGPIMARRFDLCAKKGFDGVEPDLVEAYSNHSGFPLTAADQLKYNRFIAKLAHERGLAVGLKNEVEQVPALVRSFDYSVDEQCYEFDECSGLLPFIRADKPVFHAEYTETTAAFCPTSRKLGFSSLRKRLALGVWRQTC